MTKTPNLNASRRFRLGRKQPLTSKRLTEPFLSPGGSVHTTEGIEKSKLRVRWLVLALLSLLMSGNYYCYDNPAALYTDVFAPMAARGGPYTRITQGTPAGITMRGGRAPKNCKTEKLDLCEATRGSHT